MTDIESILLNASINDNTGEVMRIIEETPSLVNLQDSRILLEACRHDNFELTKFLVKKKVNIHAGEDRAFLEACRRGHMQIVYFLMMNGADIYTCDNLALKRAFLSDNKELFINLLKLNARHNNIFDDAAKKGKKEVIEMLYCIKMYNHENMAFINACECGQSEIIDFLFEKKIVNSDHLKIGFEKACEKGHINILEKLYQMHPKLGYNQGIILASASGHKLIIDFLIKNKLCGSRQYKESMELASLNGHLEIVKKYFSIGVELTDSDYEIIVKTVAKNRKFHN